MLLIVYGSFRSLNMEREARERQEREKEAANLLGTTSTTTHATNSMLNCNFYSFFIIHKYYRLRLYYL